MSQTSQAVQDGSPSFTEHHIDRGPGRIYVRDYAGAAPAFVLMHGFPDNLHIWDDLIPHLAAGGRRIVTFDFLGFGASDKPGAGYSFAQQLGDLEAVVKHLDLGQIVPVAHDSSGIAAVNFAVEHPADVAALCILNSAYDDSPLNVWPEMITLFADPRMRALAIAIAQSPAQLEWLLTWQKQKFEDSLPADQKPRFEAFLGPLIADNFIRAPSSGTAFVTMAAQFFDELQRNTTRLPLVAALDLPVKVIWGEYDPYLNVEMGKERAGCFSNSTFTVIPAGHWLQVDAPAQVAKAMLA
jgi:pimeloyl-ACP methyl ester carboxylesterase